MANKELNLKSHIVEELHPLKVRRCLSELLTASAGTTDLRLCSLGLSKYSRTDLRPLGALSRSLALLARLLAQQAAAKRALL